MTNRIMAAWVVGCLLVSTPLWAQISRLDEAQGPDEFSGLDKPGAREAPAPTAATTPSRAAGVVNLQTTVTGNQEQPRVLYILPWQSPPPGDINFELLESRDRTVFGHLERSELRRQLESAGELDE